MIDHISASDMAGASHCALSALQLMHYATGLSGHDALFELKNCALSPAQYAVVVEAAAEDLLKEAKETEDAQAAVEKAYRARINVERIVYVCACCGIRMSAAGQPRFPVTYIVVRKHTFLST